MTKLGAISRKGPLCASPSLTFGTREERRRNSSRMASPDLVWLLVKDQSKYLVKRNGETKGSVTFTREPHNLYNLNSFKYSGLANRKTVGIEAAADEGIVLSTYKTKKGQNPSQLIHRSSMKKDFRRMAKAVINQVETNGYRADLKKAALARLSAVHKSLRVKKAVAGGNKSSSKKLARK
eukprot:jgi/Mesen1/5005/ME000025S04406